MAKAAEWNLVNAARLELREQGILVQGLRLGAADTDIMAGFDGPKLDPAIAARGLLNGVKSGAPKVVVDEWSAGGGPRLAHLPEAFCAQFD